MIKVKHFPLFGDVRGILYTLEQEDMQKIKQIEKLQKQLDIATKALREAHTFPATTTLKEWCQERLKEIDEVLK